MPDTAIGTDCGGAELIRVGGGLHSQEGTTFNGEIMSREEFDRRFPLTFNPIPRTHDDMVDSLQYVVELDIQRSQPIDPDY